MDEFTLIREVFRPLSLGAEAALGLEDDAAILTPSPGAELVITKDLIAEGVHFPEDAPAQEVAQRLLRVNLSDLASMGADSIGYFLGVAVAEIGDGSWLREFAGGLAADQEEFGIKLLGGDTISGVKTPVFSLTAVGSVPEGKALTRSGAKPADLIVVSGTIGDAALGLGILEGRFEGDDALIARYRLPQPRVRLGPMLRGLVTSCIDISDGLLADLGHIVECSGVSARVERDKIPLSPEARRLAQQSDGALAAILGGGDDYELLFTVAPGDAHKLESVATKCGIPLTVIGTIGEGDEVELLDDDGRPVRPAEAGYRHR